MTWLQQLGGCKNQLLEQEARRTSKRKPPPKNKCAQPCHAWQPVPPQIGRFTRRHEPPRAPDAGAGANFPAPAACSRGSIYSRSSSGSRRLQRAVGKLLSCSRWLPLYPKSHPQFHVVFGEERAHGQGSGEEGPAWIGQAPLRGDWSYSCHHISSLRDIFTALFWQVPSQGTFSAVHVLLQQIHQYFLIVTLSIDTLQMVEYQSALLSICFMVFLGFSDDVLDLPWR
jgi:hypothetical protein